MKVVWETRKIFGLSDDEISISCTGAYVKAHVARTNFNTRAAVRVPIMRAHSESITIETHSPVTVEDARYRKHTAGF
jgi:aspartate-semialdehyde dehydrogenase